MWTTARAVLRIVLLSSLAAVVKRVLRIRRVNDETSVKVVVSTRHAWRRARGRGDRGVIDARRARGRARRLVGSDVFVGRRVASGNVATGGNRREVYDSE